MITDITNGVTSDITIGFIGWKDAVRKTDSVGVLLESIRAVVQAYTDGKVSAEEMPVGTKTNKQDIRLAPSYQRRTKSDESWPDDGQHPYTALSLGVFLVLTRKGGDAFPRPAQRLLTALNALELIEQGLQGVGGRDAGGPQYTR